MTHSQTKDILAYLEEGNSITSIEALNKFGCFRLASRINDLRQLGHDIKTEMVGEDKKFARYTLVKKLSKEEEFDLFEPRVYPH
jgi:hypothetical protein